MDPLRGPGHPQRVLRTTQGPLLEAKVDQEAPLEGQNGPRECSGGDCGLPLGGLGDALGDFLDHFGHL